MTKPAYREGLPAVIAPEAIDIERYLTDVDDADNPFSCSPDPLLSVMQEQLKGMEPGKVVDHERLRPVLEDADVFDVD